MNTNAILPQNETAFVEFYEWLYGDNSTEYRLIKQVNGRTVTRSLVSDPDDLEGDFAKLCKLNNNGFNVYAVVNRVDLAVLSHLAGDSNHQQDPQSTADSHITAVNALFVDLDVAPADNEPSNLEKLLDAPLMPSMIVQSSLPHKLQGYWLLEPDAVSVSEFKQLQRQLARRFNGDKAVVNAARIMRVAGFNHVKDPKNPMPSRLLEADGMRYDRETVLRQLELDPTPPAPRVTVPLDLTNASKDWQRVVTALQQWQPVDGERRRATLLVMAVACELGVNQQQAIQDVSRVKQAWGSSDYLESSEACARWAYEQRPDDDKAGVGQLVKTLERELDFEIGKLDVNKWERTVHAVNKKAQLDPSEFDAVVDVNTRYLSDARDEIMSKLPTGAAVIVLQSHISTGKSTFINELTADSETLFMTPLIELCKQIASDTGAADYQTFDANDYRNYGERRNHRLVITPNSLPKLVTSRDKDQPSKIYTHPTFVSDESDANVGRLSDPSLTNEQSMFAAQKTHLAGALLKGGKAWLASAYHHSGELVLVKQVLKRLKSDYGLDIPLVLVRNHHQPQQGTTYEVLDVDVTDGKAQTAKRAAFEKLVLERAGKGERLAIACDSDAYAQTLYEAVCATYPHKRVLLIDSLHKNEPEQRAFLDPETRDAMAYDVIIYTPVLQSGFSISVDQHQHGVMGYFCARSVSPVNGVQLLGRFRGAGHVTVALEDYHDSSSQEPETIKRELLASAELEKTLVTTSLDGLRVWRDSDFTEVHAHNIAHDRWQRSSWRVHFLALLEGQGRVRQDTNTVTVDEATTKAYEGTAWGVFERECTAVASVDSVDNDTARELKQKRQLSKLEQYQLMRHDYESYYGCEVTPDRLLQDKRGRQRAKVARLALMRADDATVMHHVQSELLSAAYADGFSKAKSEAKRQRWVLKRELLRRVARAANIDPHDLRPNMPHRAYSRDSDSVKQLLRWLKKHRDAVGAVATLPKDLDKDIVRFIGQTLRECGITTSHTQQRVDGVKVNMYHAVIVTDATAKGSDPTLLDRLAERERTVSERVTEKDSILENEGGCGTAANTVTHAKAGCVTPSKNSRQTTVTAPPQQPQNQPQKWQQTLEKLLEMIDAGAVTVSESTNKHLREARAAALQGDGAMIAALQRYCKRPDVRGLLEPPRYALL